MTWTGRMPTAYFNDRQIRTREYVKWSDARRHFDHREADRKKVQELTQSIAKDGLQEPIILGVSDRYPDVYIGDGHHRAVVLMDLKIAKFPFRWYWIKSASVRMEREPFPYHLLDM